MTVRSIYDNRDDAREHEPSEPPCDDAPPEASEVRSEFVMPGGYLPPHMILRNRKPPDIIPGMCFESSVGMIVAPPYVGKTLLLIDLGLALATGSPWLKWQPKRTTASVIFALDSPGWESREQCECLMAGRGIDPASQPFFLVTREDAERMRPCDDAGEPIPGSLPLGPFDIMDERWFQHLVTIMRGSGAKLLGLDSYSKIHNRDENDRLEMEGVMKQIARLAMETQSFVLILHHTPVIERRGSVHAGRGSGVTAASVDFEASVIKTSAQDCRFEVLKGRGSDEEGEFNIRKVRVDGTTCPRAVRWEVTPPEEDKPKAGAIAWEWFQSALASGPRTRAEIGELALADNFDEPGGRKVDNYLSTFKAQGLIHSPERGKYALKRRSK